MIDRGLFITTQAIRRQLRAMPCELYLVRLIHHASGRAFPGERLWTAPQLAQPGTVRFLRIRNRQGCDVYFQPFAGDRNAGYILVDLDHAEPSVLEAMRSNGHEPCVVLASSPGHRQAWIRVSSVALEPAVATAIGRHLARRWRPGQHRLAPPGPLGRIHQSEAGAAPAQWLRSLGATPARGARLGHPWRGPAGSRPAAGEPYDQRPHGVGTGMHYSPPRPAAAPAIYQAWLHRLRIPQWFPQPDWSIADKWVAKELLRVGLPPATVAAILAQYHLVERPIEFCYICNAGIPAPEQKSKVQAIGPLIRHPRLLASKALGRLRRCVTEIRRRLKSD